MLDSANGYSLDAQQPYFDALVLDGERIVAVGSRSELKLQYGSRVDRVIDVGGATVIPGLVDSHLHLAMLGEQALRLDLSGVRSKAEMLSLIRQHTLTLRPDEWLLGSGWDDNRMHGNVTPSLAELDEAGQGRAMLLTRVCQHAYLANTRAFAWAGLGPYASDPDDGKYGRDEAGRLNGWVYENASAPLLHAVPKRTATEWQGAVRLAMDAALRSGLTAVHTDDTRSFGGFTPTWQAYVRLLQEERRYLRVHELVDWAFLDERVQMGQELPQLPAWLEAGAVKLFSDGALGGRTAWLADAYADAPDWFGTPMMAQAELNERIAMAHRHGVPAAIHAIGDAALEATLQALSLADPISGRDRIVHAELVRADLIAQLQAFGDRLAVDVQPRFTVSDFPWVVGRLGATRAAQVCAFRQLSHAGLHLAGGSDAPIEPLSPWLGIHAAVTRRKPEATGSGYEMQESLTVAEAVHLFTQGASFANGMEHEKGLVAPGWLADLTILDRDIMTASDPDELLRANVLYTVVGGHIAYAADGTKESE